MPAAFHANVIFEVGGGVVVEGVEFGLVFVGDVF